MKNRRYKIQKDLVFLTISMFITVALWVAFNVYDAYVTSTIDEVLQTQIIPIDGKFNLSAVEQLKNREKISPDYSESSPSGEVFVTPAIEIPSVTLNPSPFVSSETQQETENTESVTQ